MPRIDVTARAWERLLAIRAGRACACCGNFSEGERAALDLYAPIAHPAGDAHLIAQIGQSLDGRVATESGDARDVSGPEGLAHLHRIRALVDAVVIGVRTALHDRPRLTVRLVPGNNPARVIVDPRGRLPNDADVLAANGARRIVIQSVDKSRPEGVEVIRLAQDSWIAPGDIVAALHARGLRNLLIEGGGITIARFLEADLLDRLHVSVAPLIIGAGPQGVTTSPVSRLADARRPATRVFELGSDVLFDCEFSPAARAPTRAACHAATG